jgi:hypothetical protein
MLIDPLNNARAGNGHRAVGVVAVPTRNTEAKILGLDVGHMPMASAMSLVMHATLIC